MPANVRDDLARDILDALQRSVPGSVAVLRGSLASGSADEYSDIDVLWEVPDVRLPDAVTGVVDALSTVTPLESIRSDPAFQRSVGRRLFYVRFEGIPLFWRLDLDIFAQSVGRDDAYDRANPKARGDVWSPTESALMNVVAAIKAYLRGDDDRALQLLHRGYERVMVVRRGETLRHQLVELTEAISRLDSASAALAKRILALVAQVGPGDD